MTLYELRTSLFWILAMLLGAVLSGALATPLVTRLGLPDWLSHGIGTVLTLAGAVTFAGGVFSRFDPACAQSKGMFAAVLIPIWLLVFVGIAAAVGSHFLLLPLRLHADWHQILVMFAGVGVAGALAQGATFLWEARERARFGR